MEAKTPAKKRVGRPKKRTTSSTENLATKKTRAGIQTLKVLPEEIGKPIVVGKRTYHVTPEVENEIKDKLASHFPAGIPDDDPDMTEEELQDMKELSPEEILPDEYYQEQGLDRSPDERELYIQSVLNKATPTPSSQEIGRIKRADANWEFASRADIMNDDEPTANGNQHPQAKDKTGTHTVLLTVFIVLIAMVGTALTTLLLPDSLRVQAWNLIGIGPDYGHALTRETDSGLAASEHASILGNHGLMAGISRHDSGLMAEEKPNATSAPDEQVMINDRNAEVLDKDNLQVFGTGLSESDGTDTTARLREMDWSGERLVGSHEPQAPNPMASLTAFHLEHTGSMAETATEDRKLPDNDSGMGTRTADARFNDNPDQAEKAVAHDSLHAGYSWVKPGSTMNERPAELREVMADILLEVQELRRQSILTNDRLQELITINKTTQNQNSFPYRLSEPEMNWTPFGPTQPPLTRSPLDFGGADNLDGTNSNQAEIVNDPVLNQAEVLAASSDTVQNDANELMKENPQAPLVDAGEVIADSPTMNPARTIQTNEFVFLKQAVVGDLIDGLGEVLTIQEDSNGRLVVFEDGVVFLN